MVGEPLRPAFHVWADKCFLDLQSRNRTSRDESTFKSAPLLSSNTSVTINLLHLPSLQAKFSKGLNLDEDMPDLLEVFNDGTLTYVFSGLLHVWSLSRHQNQSIDQKFLHSFESGSMTSLQIELQSFESSQVNVPDDTLFPVKQCDTVCP